MHADLHLAMTTPFGFDTPGDILLSLIIIALPIVTAIVLLREMRRAASIAPILKWTLLPNLLAFPLYPLIFFLDDLSRTFGSLWLPAFMILCMLLHSGSGFLIKRRIFGTARLAKGMVCDACLYPQPASVASEGGRCPECGRTWTEGELPNRWQQAALYGRSRWP